jgi:hypothetical protein
MHPRREWNLSQIEGWLAEGKTHQWIADQLACAPQTIGKLAQRHGFATQRRGPRPGPGHPNWAGGVHIDKSGYRCLWVEHHPHSKSRPGKARTSGYVLEHRLVMEAHLGRYLDRGEVVHHKDGNKANNDIANLELFPNNGAHLAHELRGRCPNWTPEGKERIRAANLRRYARNRQRSLPDEQP